jgi:hypothetical protein
MTNELPQLMQNPALLQGINTTYALLAVLGGWVTHANWPRIIAAGTWVVEHGGVTGIALALIKGRPKQ